MKTGSKKTIRDVANLAGVSFSTVALAVNNDPRVKPETVLKIKEAIRVLGYVPKNINVRKGHRARPRRPTSYRKMQVALISQVKPSLLDTPVYSKVLRGIEDELGKLDYNFIIRNLPDENPEEKIPRKIDGAILFHVPAMLHNQKLLKELRRMPCVSIMGETGENEFFDHVSYNDRNVGRLAAEYLLSKGHRCFVNMGGGNIPRMTSFREKVNAAGGRTFEISGDFLDESRKTQLTNLKGIGNAIEKIKRLQEKPTAIFTPLDIIVVGLYHTLRHYDIIPGKDVDIVGVNNDSILLDHLTPRPASVDIHAEAMGRKAVERLLWRIDNPKEPLEKILLEPEMAFS